MQKVHREQQSTGDPSGADLPGPAPLNAFVINLCSSTSPVTLTPPDHAGLKRFTFFVSRRREESRERFRLHMGYFDTQEDAEKLLDIVREIYPGAWAGLAPGQRLRAAAAQDMATESPARAAEVTVANHGAAAAPVRTANIDVAQLEAPPNQGAGAEIALSAPVAGSAPAEIAELALVPDEGRRLPTDRARATENVAAARSLNDVRAAIAALDDPAERTPVLRPIPELKPAPSAPAVGATDAGAYPISEAGALALLESGAAVAAAAAAAAVAPAPRAEKPCYAVQLMWSVQSIDIAQVPQLAIFSAYTLYGAEGNRDGRRWYGVRLGFFTDAVSAKQVAHYVRSEFATVSVVPVTLRERERARLAETRPPLNPAALEETPAIVLATPPKNEFEFIEDHSRALPPVLKPGSGAARATRGAPGKRARLRTQSAAVNGGSRAKPMTLEETLEILGAGELQMDNGRGPLINQSGAVPARSKPARNRASRLARLLERLSERLGS